MNMFDRHERHVGENGEWQRELKGDNDPDVRRRPESLERAKIANSWTS